MDGQCLVGRRMDRRTVERHDVVWCSGSGRARQSRIGTGRIVVSGKGTSCPGRRVEDGRGVDAGMSGVAGLGIVRRRCAWFCPVRLVRERQAR